MNSKRIYPALLALSLLLIAVSGMPATADDVAQPELPHAFYGMVEIGGSPAGQGLVVEAVGPGVLSNTAGNPVTTLADGTYGAAGFASQKLIVQGSVDAGAPLEFYVGGIRAEVYDVVAGGPWKADFAYQPGEVTELNLRIASLPAAGQTREPTPVQTIVASSTIAASSTGAGSVPSGGSSTAAPEGSALPQVPGSLVQQPTAEVPQQSSGNSASTR